MLWPVLLAALLAVVAAPCPAGAAQTAAITLRWVEGDYGGVSRILSADGKQALGDVEYRQYRDGDRLHVSRTARFADGSRDEDEAVVRVGKRLESISGRSVLRDRRGTAIVDVRIDVADRRLRGFYREDGERHAVDEAVDIGAGTYWGPLIPLVLKNLDANATGTALVFQSVIFSPKPRVIDMELTRTGVEAIRRTGGRIEAQRFTLLPTVNFLIDPIIQRLVPETLFFIAPGKPPSLVRFAGPRNYQGQMIRIE